jgi:hypothetical protein
MRGRRSASARPRVNRPFWERLNIGWRAETAATGDEFPVWQQRLFRTGLQRAQTVHQDFVDTIASRNTYQQPKRKTLYIPLTNTDQAALAPYASLPGLTEDDAACAMLSIGCQIRGI